jgi:dTDP-4-dehydrorhamnose 3,5-epimerase
MRTQLTSLNGVVIVEPILHRDSRGLFFEAYKDSVFEKIGLPTEFLQDNVSQSKKGVIRGLHYQTPPFQQGKLVRCVKGAIFDVAVDLRLSSPTFGQVETIVLTDENHLALYIPPGFAHGFQALTDDTIIHYKCTQVFSKEHDTGINPLDDSLAIRWPQSVSEISDKDKQLPKLCDLSFKEKEQLLFK